MRASVIPKPYSDDPLRRVTRAEVSDSGAWSLVLSCGHEVVMVGGRDPLPREHCRACGEIAEAGDLTGSRGLPQPSPR